MFDLAFIQPVLDWLDQHETTAALIAGGTFVLLILQLLSIPLILAALPTDYFVTEQRITPRWLRDRPALHLTLRILANVFGLIFIILGIIMLVAPGQGIISILVGLGLTDFPAKHHLQRRLAARQPVLKTMNWCRRLLKQPPLKKPQSV